jgi:malonyl-CoA O-methyltransferase
MDKRAVRRRFDAAAGSYDQAAELQRLVGRLLLDCLPASLAVDRAIDAGAGTGDGSRRLVQRWPSIRIVAVDFATRMLSPGGICADIEALPLPDRVTDLYWSNLTWQWCDTGRAASEAHRVLRDQGVLAVSSLGPDTLCELREAFAGVDGFHHAIDFRPPEQLVDACKMAGFADTALRRETVTVHHADLRATLSALKAVGASHVDGPRRPGLLGRRAWQVLERRYEAWRSAAGLPTTYEVLLCTARKPTS